MNTETTESVPRKYVHVEGHAEIKFEDIDGKTKLILTFLDENLQPIVLAPDEPQVPLVFSKSAVKFKHVHLIASLSEEGYNKYAATLKKVDPFIEEWDELEESNDSGDMNTTDPPSN